ncbi:hypothetical protein GCM10023080_046390 [Streptomyces pseudoechinosporeus]
MVDMPRIPRPARTPDALHVALVQVAPHRLADMERQQDEVSESGAVLYAALACADFVCSGIGSHLAPLTAWLSGNGERAVLVGLATSAVGLVLLGVTAASAEALSMALAGLAIGALPQGPLPWLLAGAALLAGSLLRTRRSEPAGPGCTAADPPRTTGDHSDRRQSTARRQAASHNRHGRSLWKVWAIRRHPITRQHGTSPGPNLPIPPLLIPARVVHRGSEGGGSSREFGCGTE